MNRLVAQAIAEIAANTYAGAVEIADQGADVLLRCARTGDAETLDAFRQEVLLTGWALIRAQPAMAPLVNLVNEVLWKIDQCDTLRAVRLMIADVARDFKRRLRVHEVAIAEAVLPIIAEGTCIVTNSRSTTVRAALLHAQRAGRRFRVICAEGRPGYEGRTMAAELAEAGIPVTLVIDALAISDVTRGQTVLIGADHLSINGLVNKVGTYALAVNAQTHQIPMYALCSSEKFLPPDYTAPSQINRPEDQIWDTPPAGVAIENYYFDRTPLVCISGVVTERGIMTSTVIDGWLAAMHLHPALKAANAS